MDEELRQRFAELRAFERAQAPALQSVLARIGSASRPAWRARPGRPALLAAAGVVAAAALALWPLAGGRDDRAMPAATILEWRAPTDVLLHTPGSEVLSELPALDRSILDTRRSR